MDETDVMLMLSGVSRTCPDCGDERVFVPAEQEDAGTGAYCCTACGAALLIDIEVTELPETGRRVAS